MTRINATRAEHAIRQTKAAKAVAFRATHYTQPGVWEAERAALQADVCAAEAVGDAKAEQAARNALIVLNLRRPL